MGFVQLPCPCGQRDHQDDRLSCRSATGVRMRQTGVSLPPNPSKCISKFGAAGFMEDSGTTIGNGTGLAGGDGADLTGGGEAGSISSGAAGFFGGVQPGGSG